MYWNRYYNVYVRKNVMTNIMQMKTSDCRIILFETFQYNITYAYYIYIYTDYIVR